MTAWLIRRFVPHHDQVTQSGVRAAYGTLASITGIIVNVLLGHNNFILARFFNKKWLAISHR